MQSVFPIKKTIIVRHKKENLKKCSLRGLESRDDLLFLKYPNTKLPNLDEYILLSFDAPLLSKEDHQRGLLFIDSTWRYAETMKKTLSPQFPPTLIKRSLPEEMTTAYPRRQLDCPHPERGLATVEALYAAYFILGYSCEELLNHYHWKDLFVDLNAKVFLNKTDSQKDTPLLNK